MLMFAVVSPTSVGLGQAKEEPLPRVWIYRDVPGPKDKDTRTKSELYFQPFFYLPEKKASDISVDIKKPASDIDPDEKGTCVEFSFFNLKANDFAGAGFVPEGDLNTDKPPLNVADSLLTGFGRPVFLKFRARAKPKQTIKVCFESCGLSAGPLVDGIRPAQKPDTYPTVVADKWKEITIDLTKKAAGLDKVACPLKVIVRANENPGKEEITVYVDDIRFEVGDKKEE